MPSEIASAVSQGILFGRRVRVQHGNLELMLCCLFFYSLDSWLDSHDSSEQWLDSWSEHCQVQFLSGSLCVFKRESSWIHLFNWEVFWLHNFKFSNGLIVNFCCGIDLYFAFQLDFFTFSGIMGWRLFSLLTLFLFIIVLCSRLFREHVICLTENAWTRSITTE
jgi:hypothetical protein